MGKEKRVSNAKERISTGTKEQVTEKVILKKKEIRKQRMEEIKKRESAAPTVIKANLNSISELLPALQGTTELAAANIADNNGTFKTAPKDHATVISQFTMVSKHDAFRKSPLALLRQRVKDIVEK